MIAAAFFEFWWHGHQFPHSICTFANFQIFTLATPPRSRLLPRKMLLRAGQNPQ